MTVPGSVAAALVFALSVPARAAVTTASCGDARVDAYIADRYAAVRAKGAPAYAAMGQDSREQMCFQVAEALKRYDAALPELQAAVRAAAPESTPRFCAKLYDLLPVVRFNVGPGLGYDAVYPPPAGEAPGEQALRLGKIVDHFKAFDRPAAQPGLAVLWPPVQADLLKLAASGRRLEPPTAGRTNAATGRLLPRVPNGGEGSGLFDNALARSALIATPLTDAALGPKGRAPTVDGAVRTASPVTPPINPSAATLARLRSLGADKRTNAGEGAGDYAQASFDLITRLGNSGAALSLVMEARGGDNDDVPFSRRVQAVQEIQRMTGVMLKDPRVDSSVDDDLMHMDHYLNAHAGTQGQTFSANTEDGWFKAKGKTLMRSVGAVGGTVITCLYEGSKAVDQTFGLPTGKLVGYDFNDPRASRASVSGLWSGVSGIWRGAYDEGR